MAKLIYSMKIFMFKTKFKISLQETKSYEDISRFAISIYIKHWFSAPEAESAPRNDLLLLEELHSYKGTNEKIDNAALNRFKNHLWYLSEELFALAFFDESVSVDTKLKMRDALKNKAEDDPP